MIFLVLEIQYINVFDSHLGRDYIILIIKYKTDIIFQLVFSNINTKRETIIIKIPLKISIVFVEKTYLKINEKESVI